MKRFGLLCVLLSLTLCGCSSFSVSKYDEIMATMNRNNRNYVHRDNVYVSVNSNTYSVETEATKPILKLKNLKDDKNPELFIELMPGSSDLLEQYRSIAVNEGVSLKDLMGCDMKYIEIDSKSDIEKLYYFYYIDDSSTFALKFSGEYDVYSIFNSLEIWRNASKK